MGILSGLGSLFGSATGLGAIGSVLGGVAGVGSLISQRNTNQQLQYNAEHAMQMRVKDLKRAGLSPVLAAGGSGMSQPAIKALDFNGAIGSITDSAVRGIQADAQISQTNAQRQLIAQQIESQRQDVISKKIDNQYKVQGIEADLQSKALANTLAARTQDLNVSKLRSEVANLDSQVLARKLDMRLTQANIDSAVAQKLYTMAQTALSDQNWSMLEKEKAIKQLMIDTLEWQKKYREAHGFESGNNPSLLNRAFNVRDDLFGTLGNAVRGYSTLFGGRK